MIVGSETVYVDRLDRGGQMALFSSSRFKVQGLIRGDVGFTQGLLDGKSHLLWLILQSSIRSRCMLST